MSEVTYVVNGERMTHGGLVRKFGGVWRSGADGRTHFQRHPDATVAFCGVPFKPPCGEFGDYCVACMRQVAEGAVVP